MCIRDSFTLAEIYYEESESELALEQYQIVIDQKPNEYHEQSLVRSTQILINASRYKEALPLWRELENIAVYPDNKNYALFNLMRSYYQSKELKLAQAKAESVLELKNLAVKVTWDAYEILATTSVALGDSVKAENAFKILEKAPIDPLAAEAFYFRAHQNHQHQNFKKSNEVILSLIHI